MRELGRPHRLQDVVQDLPGLGQLQSRLFRRQSANAGMRLVVRLPLGRSHSRWQPEPSPSLSCSDASPQASVLAGAEVSQVEPGTKVAQFLSNPAVGDLVVDQLCQTMHDIARREQISLMGELNGVGNLIQLRGASAL